ncbi:MAG: hypothetical protein IH624_16485 [Phycisphaerae bacterium]|nr:hypothetical protein [Phycisphaerae bacterium]
MKRAMMLVLVLGLGSAANAGLVIEPVRWDMPSVDIAIASTGAITNFQFKIEVTEGTLSGEPVYPETWMFYPYVESRSDTHIAVMGGDFFEKAGPLAVLTGLRITFFGPASYADLIATGRNYVDGIVITAGTVMDTLYAPEPMSVMLVGLGGLFLRSRRL